MNPNASISWNTSSWLGAASRPQQQTSLKKTIQAYKAISHRLKGKLEQLLQKKEELSSRAFAVVSEVVVEREQQEGQKGSREATPTPRPLSPPPPQQIKIEASDYHSDDLSSLASAVTNILTESIEIRLAFVMEAIQYLSTLYQDNPKQRTPTELMLSRYEEWVETNQRLFELNSRLYDLEKVKFDLQQRDTVDQGSTKQEVSHTGNQLVQSNALKIQSFLSRYQFPRHTPSTTQAYLQEVLIKRGDRVTLEAQKVQEYVNECIQNSQVDLQIITGAHPQNYQQFMAVLCNFIVDRQREVQGVHLPLNLVYSTVEHVVVPQIQSAILRHAQRRDSDAKIREQCEAFSDITMHQLSIKPAYWSPQREPFIESIAQLRATYFSPTPTDKMSSVVAAAKALYDQLSSMGENSIDGDSFLDLWIYVIIKANIPDLATNIEFMSLYGNPSLGMDEAGYYLTTLSIAANFIEHKLKEEELKKHDSGHFVVCEREKFLALSQASRFCFKTESEREELRGYKVAVIKEWVLNNARLFSSVLLHTGDPGDVAVVSVISLSPEDSTAASVEYFHDKLTNPQLALKGLTTQTTPLGQAIALDLENISDSGLYFVLEDGDFDVHRPQMEHMVELMRLGSLEVKQSCDVDLQSSSSPSKGLPSNDRSYVYVFTPPQEELEGSFTHRQLLQERVPLSGSRDDARRRSKTYTEKSLTQQQSIEIDKATQDSASSSFISHSPYLVNYSPQRAGPVSMSSLPPKDTSPPPQAFIGGGALEEGGGQQESGGYCPQGEKKRGLKSSLLPSINITEMATPFTKSGHAHQEKRPSAGGYLKLEEEEEEEENGGILLSVTSDLGAESAADDPFNRSLDRFIKSDNSPGNGSSSGLLHPHRRPQAGHTSPTLSRLRKNLKSRLSLTRSKKMAVPSTNTNTATSTRDAGQEGGKWRSRSSAEEYSGAQQSGGGGRGGFVLTRLREPGPEGFLEEGYVKRLEENFRINHLFGSLTVDVEEGMRNIIRQGQMYLQNLNFLSLAVPIDGVFSTITLVAVQKFQESHNKHDFSFSSPLPSQGYLTPVTFQYLRQAFLTLYASMFKLGLLNDLPEGFDPTSVSPEDVATFRHCVSRLQESYGLACTHKGVLCQHTIEIISQSLSWQNRRNTSMSHAT